mmetsp:Transcript_37793/g.99958  ORF Transcript_37793/g.99958 Transcript_37793/m.99958 type:complete len:233 (-) Transcript_37793:269-967(-)
MDLRLSRLELRRIVIRGAGRHVKSAIETLPSFSMLVTLTRKLIRCGTVCNRLHLAFISSFVIVHLAFPCQVVGCSSKCLADQLCTTLGLCGRRFCSAQQVSRALVRLPLEGKLLIGCRSSLVCLLVIGAQLLLERSFLLQFCRHVAVLLQSLLLEAYEVLQIVLLPLLIRCSTFVPIVDWHERRLWPRISRCVPWVSHDLLDCTGRRRRLPSFWPASDDGQLLGCSQSVLGD